MILKGKHCVELDLGPKIKSQIQLKVKLLFYKKFILFTQEQEKTEYFAF